MKKRNLAKSQRWVRPLHAYSSMFMLLIMLFFTVTGLTLNNRHWTPDPPLPAEVEQQLPPALSQQLLEADHPETLAAETWQWIREEVGLASGELSSRWSAGEASLFLDVKRPGGYTYVEVFPEENYLWLENQSQGWLAVLNDLHMGRYAGEAWSWFIDFSALVMLVFTLTGFWLILFHPRRRSRTLILSGLGGTLMAGLYVWMLV
ncbi:PepSY-associated TM helix domain-containing protein [Marinospirillum sp.]|uniref:PepSY-associated TM helix domain-containing protein n=1 Tax=Marinospirillum sp. TaxID=2183934 RepID=UPI002870796B|nr:PepSY-associated TM helix domain-containing protein [Marinospirillum sp.]MDR9466880.1 PepSY-associated TM helix domain-containing protein [Marinospirillum sp.]